jgi:hypothetical protein
MFGGPLRGLGGAADTLSRYFTLSRAPDGPRTPGRRDHRGVLGGRYAPPRSGVSDFVMINELKDGRIWRDRRYYAEPFKAPEWRAEWVERVEF